MREQQEDFESMVQDYQKASELDGENRNVSFFARLFFFLERARTHLLLLRCCFSLLPLT